MVSNKYKLNMHLQLLFVSVMFAGAVGQYDIRCPVPMSPKNGQRFLNEGGLTVTFSCDPGYDLVGAQTSTCVDKEWTNGSPICVPEEENLQVPESPIVEDEVERLSSRSLFTWDHTDQVDDPKQNDTAMQNDEARINMVLYPEKRVISSRGRRIQPGSNLDNVQRRRSRIAGPQVPSVVYVRRPQVAKIKSQEQTLRNQYERAAVRADADNTDDRNRIQMARARVEVAQNDKGGQSEEALRQMYWYAQAMHPHQSLMEYRSGYPVGMTLSESQLAWINSLHPELRDRYLRDLYNMRYEHSQEGARAQEFLRRYEDNYRWWYHNPYYDQFRQPVSVVVEEEVKPTYDYTCYQTNSNGQTTLVRAPSLNDAHVFRYDRRRNNDGSGTDYLVAEYRCNPGFIMLDSRFTHLNCKQKRWIGVSPICVRSNH